VNLFRSVARSMSILAGSQALMWVAAILFTIVQARYLGPARFGELSVALSYAALLAVLIEFGLGTQLTRLVSQRASGNEEALAATVLIKGALWLLAMPLVALAMLWFGYPRELRDTILLLAVSVLFIGIAQSAASYLQGRERFFLPALASVAQRLSAAALGTFMLLVRPEITAVAGAFVVSGVVNVVVLLVGMRGGSFRPPIRVDLRNASGLFRRTVPLGLLGVATAIYWGVDMIMLERLAPPANVGWYAAAYRLFSVATILPSVAAGIALAPVLSRLSIDSRPELRAVIEKALTFLTLAGVAASLVLALFADRIIALVYPAHAYAASATALRLLAPGLLFIYVNWVLSQSLLSLHQERRLLVMAGAAAVLNVAVNLVAIPLFRENGAALTTSLTELVVLVWLVRLMPRDLLSSENIRVATRAVIAAGVTAIVFGPLSDLELALAAPMALLLFGGLLVLLRAVSTSDLDALRGLVRPAPAESRIVR
jgi:O-antigen/teichoic acid export membrane protein